MKYVSTRGQAPEVPFCDILLGGLAPDGGLYLPKEYPRVTSDMMAKWRHLSYADLAFEVLSLFIDDIPEADLRTICRKTYRPEVFANRQPSRVLAKTDPEVDIAPLMWLEGHLALLELSNGPTLAFKDVALQLVGNLFEYVLEKRGETLNVLGATSGDTGSAAEYALRGKKGVRVFMLSPHGKMSAFQRAQMYSLQDPNIFNIAINGTFDEAQIGVVKPVSKDAAFKAKYKIGAVNSINWARIAAQIVYYFKAYFAATKENDRLVNFAVPTGNFGNACAGHIARMMGLPIGKLIIATNENDVLDEFFHTGRYRPRGKHEVRDTSSPSMDITQASNFERFVFDVVDGDSEFIRNAWGDLETGRAWDVLLYGITHIRNAFGIVSGSSTHADRIQTIHDVWKEYGVMIDTHTADAVFHAMAYRHATNDTTVVLETAQPCKFDDTIREAIGQEAIRPPGLCGIEDLPQRVTVMDPDPEAIKQYIAKVCA